MTFAQIEDLLGRDVVTRVQGSVRSAYAAAGGGQEGLRAVRGLLVGVLAATVTTRRHLPYAEQLAAEDAAQLNALVRKIKNLAEPAAPRRGSRSATIVPFPTREQNTATATAATCHDARRALADVTASCSANIARMRALVAQTNGLVAQSQALLERSRRLARQPSPATPWA